MNKVYICIDLKSFYASVECRERLLDPMKTNLVVADSSRTEKTICLAISPALKSLGVSSRPRLYEVIQKVRDLNRARGYRFITKSYDLDEITCNPKIEIDYIVASPRMNKYIEYSTKIYNIYLKYISIEDIYVYSIDEVFCDITKYLKFYNLTPKELITKIIKDVYDTTGITATAGIGTNMFLAKVAMDVVAKHCLPNEFGVRIAQLDEMSFRKTLWNHRPLTDFWRIGKGIAKKLEDHNMYTLGDIARCAIDNENLLYRLFGVNAELLIDHSFGYEICDINSIKSYKPSTKSISSGQVLKCPYDYNKTKLIVKEMIDLLSLDLVQKKIVTNQIILTIGYDRENLINKSISKNYDGEITKDNYGRSIPKHSRGTINFNYTSSTEILNINVIELFDRIYNKKLLARRINISANNIIFKDNLKINHFEQLDIFNNLENNTNEKKLQEVLIDLKSKYGKNVILKGMNLIDGATTIERNKQVGGHNG